MPLRVVWRQNSRKPQQGAFSRASVACGEVAELLIEQFGAENLGKTVVVGFPYALMPSFFTAAVLEAAAAFS